MSSSDHIRLACPLTLHHRRPRRRRLRRRRCSFFSFISFLLLLFLFFCLAPSSSSFSFFLFSFFFLSSLRLVYLVLPSFTGFSYSFAGFYWVLFGFLWLVVLVLVVRLVQLLLSLLPLLLLPPPLLLLLPHSLLFSVRGIGTDRWTVQDKERHNIRLTHKQAQTRSGKPRHATHTHRYTQGQLYTHTQPHTHTPSHTHTHTRPLLRLLVAVACCFFLLFISFYRCSSSFHYAQPAGPNESNLLFFGHLGSWQWLLVVAGFFF